MDYHFDVDQAKTYGVDEAIMLQNFIFWIRHNKANKENQHEVEIEGKAQTRTWTYNTVETFAELFPFWKAGQIRRILDSLIKQGVLVKSNHNARAYDRTCWYALADESLLELPSICRNQQMDLSKSTNATAETSEPIPDLKPDKKPKERERSPACASLPESLGARLQSVARETIGAETPHVVQALELVKGGADPDLVVDAWAVMLKNRPEGAAFFATDYPTRWKPKLREKKDDDKRECPECHVWTGRGYSHMPTCSRRRTA